MSLFNDSVRTGKSRFDEEMNLLFLGHRIGCTLKFNNAATIDVEAGSIRFEDGIRRNRADISIVMGTDMESGVSEATSRWYYVYARPKRTSDERFEAIFSITPPTMSRSGRHPTKDWAYLGAVYNDGSSNIIEAYQCGNTFRWFQWYQVSTGGALAKALVAIFAPPNMLSKTLLYTAAAGFYYAYHGKASAGGAIFCGNAGSVVEGDVWTNGSSQIYHSSTTGTRTLYTTGWTDPFLP